MPHWNTKWRGLLLDVDVQRWYDNVARGSLITADIYLRVLARFLAACDLGPKEYAALDGKTREDLLADAITKQLQCRKEPSYVAGTNYRRVRGIGRQWRGWQAQVIALKRPG